MLKIVQNAQNCSKNPQNCSKLFKNLKLSKACSKCSKLFKKPQNCSKCSKLFKKLKIVQNCSKLFNPNCSKCSKLFKMFKIVQNCSKAQNCSKCVQNVQNCSKCSKEFRIDQILSNSRGKKFLKIFKNFSKCQNRKSHPTATRRKRVRELKFFEIVYAIIQNNCVKFGREKLTFEQVMSKISKNLYRAHIWAYVFPP